MLPVPFWAVLLLSALGVAISALFYNRIQQRLEGHAESIANMDAWADEVDEFIRSSKLLERQKVVKYAVDPRIAKTSAAAYIPRYERNRANAS